MPIIREAPGGPAPTKPKKRAPAATSVEVRNRGIVGAERLSRILVYNDAAKQTVDDYSKRIARLLGVRPIPVQLVYEPEYTEGAEGYYLGGGNIQLNARTGRDFGTSRHDKPDPDLVIHELAHAYTLKAAGRAPQWLVEGIAQWAVIRGKIPGRQLDEDVTKAPAEFPAYPQSKEAVESGYDSGAAFIEWLDHQRPGSAKKLARALTTGKYSPRWFQKEFGKRPAEAIAEYSGLPPEPIPYMGRAFYLEGPGSYPKALGEQYQLSPYAKRVAQIVSDYRTAITQTTGAKDFDPETGEGMYSFSDFVHDVVDTIDRGTDYLQGLRRRTDMLYAGSKQ
jgi:basic secretory peptidase family protein